MDQEGGERFRSVVYCKIQNSVLIVYSAVPERSLASGCDGRSNGKFSLFKLPKNLYPYSEHMWNRSQSLIGGILAR